MLRFVKLQRSMCSLKIFVYLSVGGATEAAYAETVYIIPNSRAVQIFKAPVEKKAFGLDSAEFPAAIGVGRPVVAGEQVGRSDVSKQLLTAPEIEQRSDISIISDVSLSAAIDEYLASSKGAATLNDEQAVSVNRLGLTTAVQQAIDSFPDIKRALEGVAEQRHHVEVAKAGYLPTISGGVRTGYQNGGSGGNGAHAFELSASQMLYDFGKVDRSVEASLAGVTQRQADVRSSLEQVTLDTAQAFLDSQFNQSAITIARDQIERLESLSALASQRFDIGASTRSDYIQTVSRIEAARLSELQYQASLASALAALENLTGNISIAAVSDEFPSILERSCEMGGADLQNHPDVMASQARVVRAQAEVQSAKVAGLPSISLEPTFTQQLNGNTGVDQSRSRYGIFLNASMPLYQGGAIQSGEAASRRALSSAQAELDTARLNARKEYQQARRQALTLQATLGVQSQREEAISQTRQLYRQQYLELGTRPFLDLLNVEQEAYMARVERQTTLNNLRQLQIDCLYNSGHLSKSFISTSNSNFFELLP